jgi:hypothetical protein
VQTGEGLEADEVAEHDGRRGVVGPVVEGGDVGGVVRSELQSHPCAL